MEPDKTLHKTYIHCNTVFTKPFPKPYNSRHKKENHKTIRKLRKTPRWCWRLDHKRSLLQGSKYLVSGFMTGCMHGFTSVAHLHLQTSNYTTRVNHETATSCMHNSTHANLETRWVWGFRDFCV